MPPKQPLHVDQIELVRQWINAGAAWAEPIPVAVKPSTKAGLWVLQPLIRPEPPRARSSSWVANPIDASSWPGSKRGGLDPAPPADRTTLIRRATFDMLGIPPTPDEVTAFLAGRLPDCLRAPGRPTAGLAPLR